MKFQTVTREFPTEKARPPETDNRSWANEANVGRGHGDIIRLTGSRHKNEYQSRPALLSKHPDIVALPCPASTWAFYGDERFLDAYCNRAVKPTAANVTAFAFDSSAEDQLATELAASVTQVEGNAPGRS